MEKESSLDKIVSTIALLCVGVCFIVWADQVTEWIATLFGVIALAYAIIAFIRFLRMPPEIRTTLPLFYIILSASAGILLISRANFIKEAISFIAGIYILLTSSVQLLNTSSLRRRLKMPVRSYLWPILGIIVGILCVTGQFIIPDELARLTGVALVIYSLVYLVGFFALHSAEKTATKSAPKIREGEIVEKSSKKSKK